MNAPGTYHGTLIEGVPCKTQKGTDQIVLRFDITLMWDGTNWQSMQIDDRRVYLSLSGAAWSYTERKLLSLGFNGDFLAPGFDQAIVTKGTQLECTENNYGGKISERWDLLGFGGGGEIERMPEGEARKLNARWKTSVSRQTKPEGAPAAPPPAQPAPAAASGGPSAAEVDAGIPF